MKKAWRNIKETFLEYKKITVASFSALVLLELCIHLLHAWHGSELMNRPKVYKEWPKIYIHIDSITGKRDTISLEEYNTKPPHSKWYTIVWVKKSN